MDYMTSMRVDACQLDELKAMARKASDRTLHARLELMAATTIEAELQKKLTLRRLRLRGISWGDRVRISFSDGDVDAVLVGLEVSCLLMDYRLEYRPLLKSGKPSKRLFHTALNMLEHMVPLKSDMPAPYVKQPQAKDGDQ